MKINKKEAMEQLKKAGMFLLITTEDNGTPEGTVCNSWGNTKDAKPIITSMLVYAIETEKYNIIHYSHQQTLTPVGLMDNGNKSN